MKTTRKNTSPIKVYALPDERTRIKEKASASNKSMSAYLLAVGQGYKVSGTTDYEVVKRLSIINGDLGRLGGLLKLWLTDNEKTQHFTPKTIRALLNKIEHTQDEMATIMTNIVKN